MDFDRLPSKPVIKSSISAQAEWDHWLEQNKCDFLRDGDGLDWRLNMVFEQLPNGAERHSGRWIVSLLLAADVAAQRLVETGTLDAEQDRRLIFLAGTGLIPLRMKKLKYEAAGDSEMRDVLARVLPELRENFRKTSLHEIKRSLLGRWLDGLSKFGDRESHMVEREFSSENDFE